MSTAAKLTIEELERGERAADIESERTGARATEANERFQRMWRIVNPGTSDDPSASVEERLEAHDGLDATRREAVRARLEGIAAARVATEARERRRAAQAAAVDEEIRVDAEPTIAAARELQKWMLRLQARENKKQGLLGPYGAANRFALPQFCVNDSGECFLNSWIERFCAEYGLTK